MSDVTSSHANSINDPFDGLPTELLVRILTLASRLSPHEEDGRLYYQRLPPPTASKVIRRWRDVTLSVPRIWASVVIGRVEYRYARSAHQAKQRPPYAPRSSLRGLLPEWSCIQLDRLGIIRRRAR